MPKIKAESGETIHLPYTKAGKKKAKKMKKAMQSKKKFGISNLKKDY